jgi:hypothetical protein
VFNFALPKAPTLAKKTSGSAVLAKLKSEGLFTKKVSLKSSDQDQNQLSSEHTELLTESIESPSFINSPKMTKSDDGATSSTTQSMKSTAVGTHFASSHQMSLKLTESGLRALQPHSKLGLSTIDEHPPCFPQVVEMANENEMDTDHQAISAIRTNTNGQ